MSNESILLKLDAQGFEKRILEGAQQSIDKINCIQIELSFQPLYGGSSNYLEMINYLDTLGFEICGIEPGFQDNKTGKLYQFDGFFISKRLNHLFK
ncbi:MAG: FkbM family methyltransferase [Ignavibacteriales bacterium]|nr:FkbM family methyltransferase [Ignavibacteriales bacterium]